MMRGQAVVLGPRWGRLRWLTETGTNRYLTGDQLGRRLVSKPVATINMQLRNKRLLLLDVASAGVGMGGQRRVG